MAQGFVVGGGGGGVGSDELTATAGDVLTGLKYVGKDTNDDVGTGTLALSGNAAVGDVASGKTFYSNNAKSKLTGTLALSGNAAVGNVLSGKTFYATSLTSKLTGTMTNQGNKSFAVDRRGSVTIPAGYYDGTGKITGPSMTDKGATTYYATTSDQTIIPAGYYTTGAQTLKKLTNTNLAAGNIKTGVTISVHNGNANVWSVAGTYKGLGNAVQADVKSGKTFSTASLSNVSGTMPAYAGQTVTPSASSQTLSISGKYNTGNVIVSAIPKNVSVSFIDAGVKNDRSVVPIDGWNTDQSEAMDNMYPYGGIYSSHRYDRIGVGKPIADLKTVGTWGNVLTEAAYLRVTYDTYEKDNMCFIARPIQTTPYSSITATARVVRDTTQSSKPYVMRAEFGISYWNDGSTNILDVYYGDQEPILDGRDDYSVTNYITLNKTYKWAAVWLVITGSSTATRYWYTYKLLPGTGIKNLVAVT